MPLRFAANLKLIPFIRLTINRELYIITTCVIVASITRSRDKNAPDIISGQRYAIRVNISERQCAASLHYISRSFAPRLKDILPAAPKSRYLAQDDLRREYLDDALTSLIILDYPVSYPYRVVWPGHYAGTWSISYGEHRKLRRARSRGEKTPVDRPADRPVVRS